MSEPNAELLRDYNSWKRSLRNFGWLQEVVPGATDIDIFIERRGKFLVLETKAWVPEIGIRVPFGQYLALIALAKVPQFTVLLIGETDTDKLYVLDIAKEAATKNKTYPVWYKHEQFVSANRKKLTKMVSDWYAMANVPA